MAPVVKGQLSHSEQKLLDAILKGSAQEIAALLNQPDVCVDCLDQTGMTPLQHAAFKGKADVCQLLLEHGADVNSNYHENGYSALHFAALSGNPDVTHIMLEAGAKRDHLNSVNRTAAQMAAFVGQHQCVRTINNFFPKEELEKFTKAQGFETEPKLPPSLLVPLVRLVNSTNIHPVKVTMFLKAHKELALEARKVARVLDILVEQSMKCRETNDVLAIKCHYFATLIRLASKALKNAEDTLDGFIKSLLKCRDDGFPEMQERTIRQCLKEFPYMESQLLQQLVRQIASVGIGDTPTALSVLTSGLYGPVWEDDSTCATCGELKAEKKCGACKSVNYCDQVCQKLHWPTHKKFCKSMAEAFQGREQRRAQQKLKEETERECKRDEEELEVMTKQASLSDNSAAGENNTVIAVQETGDSDKTRVEGEDSMTCRQQLNTGGQGEAPATRVSGKDSDVLVSENNMDK